MENEIQLISDSFRLAFTLIALNDFVFAFFVLGRFVK